jgi:hypothetical protein
LGFNSLFGAKLSCLQNLQHNLTLKITHINKILFSIDLKFEFLMGDGIHEDHEKEFPHEDDIQE